LPSPAEPSVPKSEPFNASHTANSTDTAETSVRSPPSKLISSETLNVDPPKPRPRPKPRPAYKIQPLKDNPLSTEMDEPTSYNPSIVNRSILSLQPTTMHHPRAESSESGRTAHQSGDTSPFSGDIAERAKMRSRVKASASAHTKTRTDRASGDIIELTSESEDELSLLSPSKGKAKAKRKGKERPNMSSHSPKRSKLGGEIEAPDSTLDTLPMATFDVTPSSQLPPSDPPLTSSIPPMSNPESPPSSPIPRVPSRKRKKPGAMPFEDEQFVHSKDTDSQILMPPPPPKLKALGSVESSYAVNPAASILAEAGPSSSKDSAPKAKSKARKKQALEDEEDWREALKSKDKRRTRDADEDEDGWEGSPKPKVQRKNQRKKNPKKAQKAADTEPQKGTTNEPEKRLVVEVVVSPGKGRSPRKSKTIAQEESRKDVDIAHDADTGEAATSTASAMLVLDDASGAQTSVNTKGKGKAVAKKRTVVLSDGESDEDVIAGDNAPSSVKRKSVAEPQAVPGRAGNWKVRCQFLLDFRYERY
jgi:hypothetical protein